MLDAFLSARPHEAGVWRSDRSSDGIETCRVVEETATSFSVCGRIWEIVGQTVHTFWLDVSCDDGERARWTLYFDVADSLSDRRARHAASVLVRADEIEWRAKLSGEVSFKSGAS